ncbi:unnamed protein product [Brachionus calyciflorus]|uniref:Nitric oxide synthase-interacting protein zinc-finger domain-containing protein n=1 Tax=Brachionus calyciflorus TaxID=104777 RepID=A0A813MXV5_9BILA|nr:unnamed protein product [Brachionus calyciflorus]
MTRHSKNATAGPTYTYHEKSKDTKQSGYGTKDVRLSKDAIKDFDCCSLSLQPCDHPVITPEGWIFEKEAILEYILHKKLENAKLLKKYQKQKEEQDKDMKDLAEIESKERLDKFLKTEGKLVSSSNSKDTPSTSKKTDEKTVNNMAGELGKKLPSFWIPSLSPASNTKGPLNKPDTTIYCPMSGKPISMKDLIDVKFKLLDENEKRAKLISKTERYVCPVSNDILSNSIQCVVLRTSGSVVTAEVTEKVIKKDMIDPINGKKMTEKDFIYIQRGGTGYAGSGVTLQSKKVGPAMQ